MVITSYTSSQILIAHVVPEICCVHSIMLSPACQSFAPTAMSPIPPLYCQSLVGLDSTKGGVDLEQIAQYSFISHTLTRHDYAIWYSG